MSKAIKNCIALLLITLVAGFALAGVNEITKEPIAQAEYNAKIEAYNAVYPNASFVENKAVDVPRDINLSSGACTINDCLAVELDGKTAGYVMSTTAHNGYGGDVTIAIGIDASTDKITGIQILSQSETAGLGARCTEEEFTNQFSTKSAKGITYTKDGATTDTEIDAISGATITTNAVTSAVNASLQYYNEIKEG